MGQVFKASSKAADAPDIEGGFYDARFDGVEEKLIKGGQYTVDTVNGDPKFEWAFTLLDDEGAVLYEEGDPIEVTGLTSTSTNIASKTQPRAVRYLKAIMTPAEFAQFELGDEGDGVDIEAMLGRKVQVEVAIKENGWPTIANVLPPRKARKAKVTPTASIDED